MGTLGGVAWGVVTSGLFILGTYLLVTGILEHFQEKRRAERPREDLREQLTDKEQARRLREDILDQRPEWREKQ